MGLIEDYNIDEIADGAILLDGLEEAIIGVVEEFGNGPRVLYSKNKTDIKGKFLIKWKGIEKKFLKECYQEDPLQFSVVVLDIESDNEIYRGEVTSDFCEGDYLLKLTLGSPNIPHSVNPFQFTSPTIHYY